MSSNFNSKSFGLVERIRIACNPNPRVILSSLAHTANASADAPEALHLTNIELVAAYDATLEILSNAMALRKKDKEREGHVQRVTDMTVNLAREMGFGEAELAHVRRGALLHDIGEIAVPDSILLKSGPLLPNERAIMRNHPQYAYEMLYPIEYLRPALDIPYCHHERWDGMGYPRGLKGDQIPRAARIFSVVDVWDALHSDRPFRKSWSDEEVTRYLKTQSGTEFDPEVIAIFCK